MESTSAQWLKDRLRKLREQNSLTQEEFAELSGITYKYYQSIEQGNKRDLMLSTVDRIAKAYGIEVWQLFAPEIPKCRLAHAKAKTHRRKE